MSLWLVTFILALAATIWVYTRLAQTNGNADPKKNFIGAGLAGVGIFIVVMILIKFIFKWEG